MSDNQSNLATLETLLFEDKVPAKSVNFVDSLVSKAQQGRLTENGWSWVAKTVAQYTRVVPEVKIGSFSAVYDFILAARKHMKYPKIHLQTKETKKGAKDGLPVMIAMSGSRSSRPDTVTVTDGGSYGENIWYGRITAKGVWEQSFRCDTYPERTKSIVTLLKQLAKDPAKTAAEYGKLTGNCCFCYLPIGQGDDKRSLKVGYGSTCAKNYGLPWGEK